MIVRLLPQALRGTAYPPDAPLGNGTIYSNPAH